MYRTPSHSVMGAVGSWVPYLFLKVPNRTELQRILALLFLAPSLKKLQGSSVWQQA